MSEVFCKQCGVTDDQQAKCGDGCGVFCQECDEFIDVEEDTEEGKMNYRKRHGAPLGLMGNSRVSRRFRLLPCERVRLMVIMPSLPSEGESNSSSSFVLSTCSW